MADGEYRPFKCGSCGIYGLQSRSGPPRKTCVDCKPKHEKRIYTSNPCRQCGKGLRGTAKQLAERVFCSVQCNADDRKACNVRQCEVCGSAFHRRPGGNQVKLGQQLRYCSNECKFIGQRLPEEEAARREQERDRKRAVKELISSIRRLAKAKKKAEPCICVDCGISFQSGHGESKSVCLKCRGIRSGIAKAAYKQSESYRAMRRISKGRYKAARRARISIVRECIDPLKVFTRDGWKCKLCGDKTPKSLRGTYQPKAPELDHIVPLALGGHHTWSNVQCACRECNITKGAKPLGQLGLGF